MLSKLRQVLGKKALRSVYYAIFESHLCYASFFSAENTNSIKRLHLLQQKIPQDTALLRVDIPTQVFYLMAPKFLSPLTRLLLETVFLLANL